MRKLKRLIQWVRLIWSIEDDYIGLYRVMELKMDNILKDIDIPDEFSYNTLLDATNNMYAVVNGIDKSKLNSVTESIRKHSTKWTGKLHKKVKI